MKTPKPALTHREAVDHFPILKHQAVGFDQGRIISPDDFLQASAHHGSGALQCALFVLSLAGFKTKEPCIVWEMFNRVDGEHKRAAVRLFKAVAERGIK